MGRTRGRQEHPKGRKISLTPEQRAHIRGLREGKGWSQQELADRALTTQGTISNIESGNRQVYVEVYQRVLAALKVEAIVKDYYERIVEGAADLTEADQFTVVTLVEALKKAREQTK